MKLNRLELKNIRSYKDATLVFPPGSTLLMGDIGSGKTSILLAIEFALFGLQPSQRGSSLLRNNEEEAFVKLEFELDGKEVIIERKLKKTSKSITQGEATIIIDNERQDASVTEIKNKVLQLLNYPQEFAKKTNDLYKFTVYTPQEEMKQIILETSETRLNTLRHIFGIDKYKRISENLSTLGVRLRQETRLKEAQLGDIDDKKQEINTKTDLLIKEKQIITELEQQLLRVQAKNEVKENEIKDLELKIIERNNIEREKAKTEILLSSKRDLINHHEREILNLNQQIEQGRKFELDEDKERALKTRISTQEELLKRTQEELLVIRSKLQSHESRNSEINSLKMKIQGLHKCPTCLQEVNEQYKHNIVSKANKELNVITEQSQLFEVKKQELNQKIEQMKKQVDLFKTSLSEMEILKVKLQSLDEKKQKVKEIESEKQMITKDIILISNQMKRFNELIEEFDKYKPEYDKRNKELIEIRKEQQNLEIKKAETNKDIQFLEQQIKLLQEQIIVLEALSKQINSLKELESWLSNKFAQLILYTEKNVMLKLKEEFSNLFSQWFSILVADTLSVRLDDSFSPIVQQQDYEIEYQYLSGGERTAVALAYRLALNQVINSLLSKIKTHDLVILDEPTDGFSDSQLDRMRDVLDQLKVKQLILVSHEQKIEGFVDNIIRMKKLDGVTEVEE